MDGRELVIVALALVAPWAIVLVVALLRGYSITVLLSRVTRARKPDDD